MSRCELPLVRLALLEPVFAAGDVCSEEPDRLESPLRTRDAWCIPDEVLERRELHFYPEQTRGGLALGTRLEPFGHLARVLACEEREERREQ
jgi:hypothetical protein